MEITPVIHSLGGSKLNVVYTVSWAVPAKGALLLLSYRSSRTVTEVHCDSVCSKDPDLRPGGSLSPSTFMSHFMKF